MIQPPSPAPARGFFDAALCYQEATDVLAQNLLGNPRLLAPFCAFSAFTVELYIKCLLADLGCTIPIVHDLLELFETMPRQTKERIEKRHRKHPRTIQIVEH